MNGIKITQQSKNKGRFVSALLIMNGIKQADLIEELERRHIKCSQSFLSMIITGSRVGTKKKGKLVLQVIAEFLGMKVEDLRPKRAA